MSSLPESTFPAVVGAVRDGAMILSIIAIHLLVVIACLVAIVKLVQWVV